MLIETIEVLCYLIKNRKQQYLKNQMYRTVKLQNFMRNIEKIKVEVQELAVVQQKQRSDFIQFQRNAKMDWKAVELLRTKVKKNKDHAFEIQVREFSSKMLANSCKYESKKKSVEKEVELSKLHSTFMGEIQNSQLSNLYHVRCKVRKRCLDQLAKYDENIKLLYTYEMTLLRDKDCLVKDYAAMQSKILEQHSLYNQLKEEQELNAMKASLAKVERFRLNRAAKLIQETWRSYCIRVCSKKKRSRK
ncbi:PREDICTED: IQ domain-containing protein D-like [Dufourea novaeangliae]|uniref:IQ domain-containing protein D-like n=1 Tax=Dufourea novaeangliae TaxID=178035 RepID=UPI000767629A|nr:PREDICTED: IQ domain-containing protein D-like [Dufourea novaeangliae]